MLRGHGTMPLKVCNRLRDTRDFAAAVARGSPSPAAGVSLPVSRFRGRAGGGPRSDWRRAVAAVSERRVAQGRALYTERSAAELYRGARSSERERYARARGPRKFAPANFWGEQASRLGAERPSTSQPPSVFIIVGCTGYGSADPTRGWTAMACSPARMRAVRMAAAVSSEVIHGMRRCSALRRS